MIRGLAVVAMFTAACNQLLDTPEVHRGPCSHMAELVQLAPVGGLPSDLGVQAAQLSRDERSIVFSRLTVAGPEGDPVSRLGDLYVARRARPTDPFGDAVPLEELNTEFDEHSASLSDDALTAYFDRRDQSQRYRIFVATRPEPAAPFAQPAPVALGDGTESEVEPFITDTALFFASRRSDGAATLFAAAGRGVPFAPPRSVMALEMQPFATTVENPVVSFDGLTIYFSAPPDPASPRDIWMAARPDVGQAFGAPRRIAAVSSPSDDRPTWISEDNCRLYFLTNRTGQGFALWMASRRAPERAP